MREMGCVIRPVDVIEASQAGAVGCRTSAHQRHVASADSILPFAVTDARRGPLFVGVDEVASIRA